MEAPPAGLQQRVVLVEPAALRDVEEQVAPFYPHVHAHVAASAGHRLAAVAALGGPYQGFGNIVAWLLCSRGSDDAKKPGDEKNAMLHDWEDWFFFLDSLDFLDILDFLDFLDFLDYLLFR